MIEFVSCKRFWWWCSSFLHWRVKHRNESLPLLASAFFRFRKLDWRTRSFFLFFFFFLFFLYRNIIYLRINVSSAEIRFFFTSFSGIYFTLLPVMPEVAPFWKRKTSPETTLSYSIELNWIWSELIALEQVDGCNSAWKLDWNINARQLLTINQAGNWFINKRNQNPNEFNDEASEKAVRYPNQLCGLWWRELLMAKCAGCDVVTIWWSVGNQRRRLAPSFDLTNHVSEARPLSQQQQQLTTLTSG